jgi:hypothetical protein
MYRNDYALTIALRTINGHLDNQQDAITGRLIHASDTVKIERVDDVTYNVKSDMSSNGTTRQQYIKIRDYDFHMINKNNFMELMV